MFIFHYLKKKLSPLNGCLKGNNCASFVYLRREGTIEFELVLTIILIKVCDLRAQVFKFWYNEISYYIRKTN